MPTQLFESTPKGGKRTQNEKGHKIMGYRKIAINTSGISAFDFASECFVNHVDGITCGTADFDEPEIRGQVRETLLNDFKVINVNLKLSGKPVIHFSYSGRALEMLFITKGNLAMHFKDQQQHIFHKHTHNLLFSNHASGYFEPDGKELQFVCIQLYRDFFDKFLPWDNCFGAFRNMIKQGQTGCIKNTNYPITPEMYFLIEDMTSALQEEIPKKPLIYARILELLLLQTEQYGDPKGEALKNISPSDRDKIYKAKAYLLKNYGQKITLQDLAKKIGTNEFLLKSGFKTIFGTTVFGCIHHLRMTQARKLLLEQKLTVSQVSDMAGYKNPQHFSTAFKKKFGFVPSKLKNN